MSSQSFQISENALTNIIKSSKEKARGFWSYNEDCKLLSWIQTKGPKKWTACAKTIPGRTGKQCRERWFNSLNPEVKTGQWTMEEDYKIYVLYSYLGGKWSKIAKYFSNRTENSIKNRFYSSLRKLYSEKEKVDNNKNENKMKCNLKSSSVGIKELKKLFPIAKEMLAEKLMIVKHMNKDTFEIYEKEITDKIKSGKKGNKKNKLLFKLRREIDKNDTNENVHNNNDINDQNNSISDINSEEEISFLEKEAISLLNLSTTNSNNNNNNFNSNYKPNHHFPFFNAHSCLFTSFNNNDNNNNTNLHINNIYSNLLHEFTDLEMMINLSKHDVMKNLKNQTHGKVI